MTKKEKEELKLEVSRTAFVSGHLDLTKEEFEEHYLQRIKGLYYLGFGFVVGDAPGCDTITHDYLRSLDAPVIVYHMLEAPRTNTHEFKTVGGFDCDEARDAAMTAASICDVAWVRPGREKSGTAKNIARRSGSENSVKPAKPSRLKKSDVVPGIVVNVKNIKDGLTLDSYKLFSGVAVVAPAGTTLTICSKPRKIDGINLVSVECDGKKYEVYYCDIVQKCVPA